MRGVVGWSAGGAIAGRRRALLRLGRAAAGSRRCFSAGLAVRVGRRCARGRLVGVGVWHVEYCGVAGEPEGVGCGSAGSGQLDGADGRGLWGAGCPGSHFAWEAAAAVK
jgi:hypothetical protein